MGPCNERVRLKQSLETNRECACASLYQASRLDQKAAVLTLVQLFSEVARLDPSYLNQKFRPQNFAKVSTKRPILSDCMINASRWFFYFCRRPPQGDGNLEKEHAKRPFDDDANKLEDLAQFVELEQTTEPEGSDPRQLSKTSAFWNSGQPQLTQNVPNASDESETAKLSALRDQNSSTTTRFVAPKRSTVPRTEWSESKCLTLLRQKSQTRLAPSEEHRTSTSCLLGGRTSDDAAASHAYITLRNPFAAAFVRFKLKNGAIKLSGLSFKLISERHSLAYYYNISQRTGHAFAILHPLHTWRHDHQT